MWIHNTGLRRRSPGGDLVLCRKHVPSRHIKLSGRAFSPWLVNSASLLFDVDRWPSCRLLAYAFWGCWFDLQWWRSLYALLMRPSKVERAVPYVACRCLPNFLVVEIQYIYIYIYMLAGISLTLSIINHFRQVLQAISCVRTELL